MSIQNIQTMDTLPIELQIGDGDITQFPQAEIRDNDNNLLDPLDLVHVVSGNYKPIAPYIMPNELYLSIIYIVYSDAGHTILNTDYERDTEVFYQILPDEFKANVSLLSLEATSQSIKNQTDLLHFDGGNNIHASISDKGVLNNPPSENIDDYKATGFSVPNEYNTELTAIQVDLDNPDQYKAVGFAVSGEYNTELAAIQADLDANEVKIDAIQADLNNPDQYKADISLIALESTSQDILGQIDSIPSGGSLRLKIESHTVSQYFRDMTGTTVAMITLDGIPVSGAVVIADYYKPDNSIFLAASPFIEIGTTGIYYNNYNIPPTADQGIYKVKINAIYEVGGSSFTDDFTEPNGPASNWTVQGGTWGIESNIYKETSQYGGSLSVLNDSSAFNWKDYSFEADIRRDFSHDHTYNGVVGRWQDSSTNYWFYMSPVDNTVKLLGNGVDETTIYTFNVGEWYTFKMVFLGNNIKCYVNNIEVIDATDPTPIENGKVGFKNGNFGASFDNVSVVVDETEYESYQVKDFIVDDNYKADISPLALETTLQFVKAKTDVLKDSWNDPDAATIADAVLDETA